MDFSLHTVPLVQIHIFTSNDVCCISSYIQIQVIFRLYAGSECSV